jgi:hypothetical protein
MGGSAAGLDGTIRRRPARVGLVDHAGELNCLTGFIDIAIPLSNNREWGLD